MLAIDPVSARLAFEGGPSAVGKTRVALEEMERLFLNSLLKEMRKSIPDSGLMEKSNATVMFEEMLDDVYSAEMARSGQLGIAEAMEVQMDQKGLADGHRTRLHEQYVRMLAEQEVQQTAGIAD